MKNLMLLCIIFLLSINKLAAQTTNYQGYALFLAGLAKHIYYPETSSEFKITVVGKSKIYEELGKITMGKKIGNSSIVVKQVEDFNSMESSKIIYISDNKSGELDEIILKTKGKPILVITEREGLYKKGAGMSFVILGDNKLRLDINQGDILSRQLKIPSQVLIMLGNDSI
jgi:hypothetical protein